MQGMQKKEEEANGEVVRDRDEKIATKKEEGKGEEENNNKPPPLMALNHVSRLCRNLKESIDFYTKVLGFVLIERPHAFDFDGAWMFNYGVGVHLLQAKDKYENMEEMEKKLKDLNIKYKKRTVEDVENRTKIDQLFFNDPDGIMIEICNCENSSRFSRQNKASN
ncbi:hypothetical protein SO802_008484 [Lithocarpus litseifolius]|uniref:VOC domain-containing protein n=1 Tax=Lithocarpus litseifolius TaxID=425828 RepID=A0AAW2D8Q8_9ROSI